MTDKPLPGICKRCGQRVVLVHGVWCEPESGDIAHRCAS